MGQAREVRVQGQAGEWVIALEVAVKVKGVTAGVWAAGQEEGDVSGHHGRMICLKNLCGA